MISRPLVRYILTAALRDRLVLSLFLLMAVGTSIAVFLGSAAIIETDYFAVVFAGGGLRVAGAAGLILFIVFYLRRSFDGKDVDFLLARPLSRSCFLLSHAVAFMILALFVAVAVFVTVCLLPSSTLGPGYGLWGASLLAEYIILANATLFFAMVLPNAAVCSLVIFAFYVLARIIGQILGIIKAGLVNATGFDLLGGIMHAISMVIPRLDLMAQTSWLVYGPDQAAAIGYEFILLQAFLFSALAIAAAFVDLVRRQF